ncbi:MAG: hypothetical protein ACJ76N_00915 [Thermoanaerobaculia bacterium]
MKKCVKRQSREQIVAVPENRLEQVKGGSGYIVAWGLQDDPSQDGGQ